MRARSTRVFIRARRATGAPAGGTKRLRADSHTMESPLSPMASPTSPSLLWRSPLEADDAARLARLRETLRLHASRCLPCSKRAAVAALLRVSSRGALELLFIKRSSHPNDPWSGDVAFPGGRLNPGESELQAAKREVLEEIGVDLECGWELLGPLDDRIAALRGGIPKLVVRTLVFFQSSGTLFHNEPPRAPPPLTLLEKEVAAAWWVPLSLLSHAPVPLPLFEVPLSRLATRFPLLRDPDVQGLLSTAGLREAQFSFLLLSPPPSCGAFGATRLWGVTLGLCESLMRAADGEERRLRVMPWRLKGRWNLVLKLARLLGLAASN